MKQSILIKSKPPKSIIEERSINPQNGNDAELMVASKLILGAGCEVAWGSRNVDGSKVDLICTYDHPWIKKERIFFLVQVKSGNTYGKVFENGFQLKSKAKILAQRTSHPICVVWVDRTTNNSFWSYIHPNTISGNQYYGSNHRINPALRYDIARCQCQFLHIKKGGKGIIINSKVTDWRILRDRAEMVYKALKGKNIINPHLGKIETTRIGWRHMFRKTRSWTNKLKSLKAILYFDKIISDLATEIYVSKTEYFNQGDFEGRHCEYVLKYNDVKHYPDQNISVIVRLIEETRWPVNWMENSALTQFIERRVILLSCYYK